MRAESVIAYSLKAALINVVLFGLVGAALVAGVVRQPWDLLAIAVVAIICPVAGVWIALSTARTEIRRGCAKAQPTIAIVLSLIVFIVGLLLLTSLRP
jgi:H+/Cl- antiporter ClcA